MLSMRGFLALQYQLAGAIPRLLSMNQHPTNAATPPPLLWKPCASPPRVPQVAAGKLNLVVAREILKGGNLNAL